MLTSLSRRSLLGLLMSFGCVFQDKLAWADALRPESPERLLAETALTVLKHKGSAQIIGRWYLEQDPKEASVVILIRRLVRDPDGSRVAQLARNPDSVHQVIRSNIQNDFDGNNLIQLNHWILSRTEARLYALSALD